MDSPGWVLFTGRDADLEPPSAWWRGPAWIKSALTASALTVLMGLTYGSWARYLGSERTRRRPNWSTPSTREREVLRLIAKGRSNPEIAADLVLSA